MNSRELRQIGKDRLAVWLDHVVQQHATPLLLIACGHDDKSGVLHVHTLEGIDDDYVIACLRFAIAELEKAQAARRGIPPTRA